MNIILKDKGIIIPEKDVKYLEEVKRFFSCDIEGFKQILCEDFISILTAAMLFSGDPITLPDGKIIKMTEGEEIEEIGPKRKGKNKFHLKRKK